MAQMDFFVEQAEREFRAYAPLAERMRPTCLEEFTGQSHLLGQGKILDRILKYQKPQSFILWGPPGCGKTTLAGIIASQIYGHLISLSAVSAGTKDIRSAVEEARTIWLNEKKRTWLFMDEIHRLNKAQQDTLLPYVEDGTLLLLGATTENPSFEIIRPLLSRAQVLLLEPLNEKDLKILIKKALEDKERGLGNYKSYLTSQAEDYLIAVSGGDARVILNNLETVVVTSPPGEIDLEAIKDAIKRKAVHYDKSGEEHYNLISALHKSIRGSDPDAGLYWLARMLEGGEDPLYICRRLIRVASEDIGLADPFALMEAVHTFHAYEFLGSPEGELAIAQLVVYLSLAQKSNSVYTAFEKAKELAKNTGASSVPFHIRNAPTGLMKGIGYGRNYKYPHDAPGGWVPETYFPEGLKGNIFYYPSSRGWEGKKGEELARRRREVDKYD